MSFANPRLSIMTALQHREEDASSRHCDQSKCPPNLGQRTVHHDKSKRSPADRRLVPTIAGWRTRCISVGGSTRAPLIPHHSRNGTKGPVQPAIELVIAAPHNDVRHEAALNGSWRDEGVAALVDGWTVLRRDARRVSPRDR